ncbi:MAG: hypothetical protein HKN70_05835 [Gammaproteobacteria bacterium]|nr:hypothetical protein [Gammaproteobacteria bacterium]
MKRLNTIYIATIVGTALTLFQWELCARASVTRPVQIPGTRVVLDVPDNFHISESFPGIEHDREQVAVSVSEIPTSYLEFSKRYTGTELNKPDTRLLRRERMDKDGLSGHLLVVDQKIKNRRFERWIFITGDTDESVVITGYFPRARAHKYRDLIDTTIRSAFWDSAKVLDHYQGLGFRLDDVPNLRVASRLNNNLIYTATGRLPDLYYTDALLFVNFRSYAPGTNITEQFARDQFAKISLLSKPAIDDIQTRQLRGVDSIIIEGRGFHAHLGYAIAAIQVIAMTETGALIAQGFTTLDNRDNDFDVFKTTIASFRLEDN